MEGFLHFQQLLVHRKGGLVFRMAQGMQSEQVLPQSDGDSHDAGPHVSHQRKSLRPLIRDDPVFLPEGVSVELVVVGPLGVTYHRRQQGC